MRVLILLFCTLPLFAQSNTGEIRLSISDPHGFGAKSSVEVTSAANEYHKTFFTSDAGEVSIKRLPFGVYLVVISSTGFASISANLEVRSSSPTERHFALGVAALNTSVEVTANSTLIDPRRTATINHIGQQTIQDRATSLPGRGAIELINQQPGWLLESNEVPHPRGSEYQTQFVIDGIPLTENRSPGFAPQIDTEDVQSMSVYTAGIPAEFGRKLGGVVEVNTIKDSRDGLHGVIEGSGGSFTTASGYGQLQYQWGNNALTVSATGATTDWYMNPPVPQNYSNHGSATGYSVHYERDLTPSDRLGFMVRYGSAGFLVPNEQLQQAAGQVQERVNSETAGIFSYSHMFSPNLLLDVRGMGRDFDTNLRSNLFSTPIIAGQDRGFQEGYGKASLSWTRGKHTVKAGVEADFLNLHERFAYIITDPSQFDPDTPPSFHFYETRPDKEQSAFIQDTIRLKEWTISAGLRWDHYQLLVNQNAVSPRLAVSRYFAGANLLVHAAYDRIFQTPAFENILLSSSPEVVALNPNVLRLPVEPSHGNYFEAGASLGLAARIRMDANYFLRTVNNFADDDLLLNTGITFPIAFRNAKIYGAEGKLEIPRWGRLSAVVSYSYMVGFANLPVTGGLFLGDEATDALSQTNGKIRISQDQRNTVRTRFQYQIVPRAWAALGAWYCSGLPIEFDGTSEDAIATYGRAVVDQVNFERARVRPSYSIDLSLGAIAWKSDQLAIKLQADGQNLTNHLNLINFAGLFSGNTLAAPRSFALRLTTTF
jgi:hypothetical protein